VKIFSSLKLIIEEAGKSYYQSMSEKIVFVSKCTDPNPSAFGEMVAIKSIPWRKGESLDWDLTGLNCASLYLNQLGTGLVGRLWAGGCHN
jgi:hypothetical protein